MLTPSPEISVESFTGAPSDPSPLLNVTPIKERGMSLLEKILGLGTTDWVAPLVSSNTQNGNVENGDGSDGAPVKDSTDISGDGVSTRDKK